MSLERSYGPPTPLFLDGIVFFNDCAAHEVAWRDGGLIGEINFDDDYQRWTARKGDGEWKPMRCAAEGRAFIVSTTVKRTDGVE